MDSFCKYVGTFLALFCLLHHADAANILVTVVSITDSQNLVMYRLAEIMGERGHNVTILKLEFFPESKKIPLKYVKEIKYPAVPDPEITPCVIAGKDYWSQKSPQSIPIEKGIKIFRQIRLSCESLLERKDILEKLNASHFDVMVIHLLDFCSFGLTRVLQVDAYVWMSTAMLIDPMAWYSGSPLAHSYIPNIFVTPSVPDGQLTFLERLKNFIMSILTLGAFQNGIVQTYTDVFRQHYGPDFPHFDDIFKKTQLYFVNVELNFEYAQPVSPNVINIGGLTMKQEAEPLNEEWQKVMDNAPADGVVIFSLGTVADTTIMPKHIRMAFLNAFKRFPHLFIWKFEGTFKEAKTVKNVKLANWLPQKDLMGHPKVKAAIIHGGTNSLAEATYVGVPIIALPLWGDQYGNVMHILRNKIGVKLDLGNLTEQSVYEALHKVLYDQNIQENAKLFGQMIREKPFSSQEQAVEWLEYLAKFKRLDQLQPDSHRVYLAQYLLLDIVIFLMAIIFAMVAMTALCIRTCIRLCCKGSNILGDKKKDE